MPFSLSKKNLHHAHAALTSDGVVTMLLTFFEKELGTAIVANPDFVHEQLETMTIDDSRRIKEIALTKRFSDASPRIFLLELYGATREAQNALLKLLEEPEEGNHFFVVVPSFDILLPTLRSRFSFLTNASGAAFSSATSLTTSASSAVEAFVKSPLGEKIIVVDRLAADISDEKKAKHDALDFIHNLEKSLYQEMTNVNRELRQQAIAEKKPTFEAIARARAYLADRAPSTKMLLEYVALSL